MTEHDDNVIELDAYRAERIAEGTWPPDQDKIRTREYWASRRSRGVRPVYDKPKDGGAA